VLLVKSLIELWGAPVLRGQEAVTLSDGSEDGVQEVTLGPGASSGLCIAIVDTGILQDLLGSWSSDDSGTSWGGDKSNSDGSASTGHLEWNGMWLTDFVTPVSLPDWSEVHLGIQGSALDGTLHFLMSLLTETDVSVLITNQDPSLEPGSLTGLGLLLDWLDFHDLFLEGVVVPLDKGVDNTWLLDGDGVSEDLLE